MINEYKDAYWSLLVIDETGIAYHFDRVNTGWWWNSQVFRSLVQRLKPILGIELGRRSHLGFSEAAERSGAVPNQVRPENSSRDQAVKGRSETPFTISAEKAAAYSEKVKRKDLDNWYHRRDTQYLS